VDLVTVKDLLGHSTIAMTMRYAHSSPVNQKRAVALLNNRFEVQGGQKMDIAFAG
jgi:integrase